MKEFLPGDEVMSTNHPKIIGTIIDMRDRKILGKDYKIYKIRGEHGIEWVNGLYLTPRNK